MIIFESCKMEDCKPHEDQYCLVEGHEPYTKCPHYFKNEKDGKEEVHKDEVSLQNNEYATVIPWTGNVLGLKNLSLLTTINTPVIIGVAGMAGSGKTTFLAALYCLLRRGDQIGNFTFAGSLTLTGWENIAWYLSWKKKHQIEYPPHTSRSAGRVPGLLHLILKDPLGKHIDLIFTDAPGEWFAAWATNKNADNAKGARWVDQVADAFLLFADCEELSDSIKKGIARRKVKALLDRIANLQANVPLGLIWAKSDKKATAEKEQINQFVQKKVIPVYQDFEVSVLDHALQNNVLKSIAWLLQELQKAKQAERGNFAALNISSQKPDDLFLSKR